MVIESTVICLDNTDYMRNEDYLPSRMMAACEVVDFVVQSKLRSNPENHVAIVTLSNHEVICNLSTDHTKLFMDMKNVKIGGNIKFCQSLSVAHLILKHRPMKNHKCRVVALVGSPLEINDVSIQPVGKKFKKENVAVDIITFGEEEGQNDLRQLVDILNGPAGKNSTITMVPRGVDLLSTIMSLGSFGGSSESDREQLNDAEDEELMMALAMSLRETTQATPARPPPAQVTNESPLGIQDGNALSDEEQLALALQMSLQENQNTPKETNDHGNFAPITSVRNKEAPLKNAQPSAAPSSTKTESTKETLETLKSTNGKTNKSNESSRSRSSSSRRPSDQDEKSAKDSPGKKNNSNKDKQVDNKSPPKK